MLSFKWHFALALFCVIGICASLQAGITTNVGTEKVKFYVGTEKVTRDEAEQLCKKKCMELVSIQNISMSLQLVELFINNSINGAVWTSGRRSKDGKTWSWLNGDQIQLPNMCSIVPNAIKSADICIAVSLITNKITLKVQPCEEKSGYICAMPANQNQEEFYISKELGNPAEARKACAKKCMQLISIRSKEENDGLYELITRNNGTNTRYWTTGHRQANAKWIWSENDPITFTRWGKSEPNSQRNKPSCIEIYISNKGVFWNDHYCSLKRKFICEKVEENK